MALEPDKAVKPLARVQCATLTAARAQVLVAGHQEIRSVAPAALWNMSGANRGKKAACKIMGGADELLGPRAPRSAHVGCNSSFSFLRNVAVARRSNKLQFCHQTSCIGAPDPTPNTPRNGANHSRHRHCGQSKKSTRIRGLSRLSRVGRNEI